MPAHHVIPTIAWIAWAATAAAAADALPGASPFDASLQSSLTRAAAALVKTTPPRTKHLTPDGSPKYVNRLVLESSPYLQQHAFNPVNWYPWGDEAFAAARRENKPVFLSIGYSTCHWCHVMEEESFDNEAIAELLNRHFIAIKVDREARPDLDNVYIQAVSRITGGAGWPLTAFLTPDRKPFYGGTYFPPEDRQGRPGMPNLLRTISKVWSEDPQKAVTAAGDLTATLQSQTTPESVDLGVQILANAATTFAASFDGAHGGFGAAPKFPQAHGLTFLARYYHRSGNARTLEMAEATLDHLAAGGIHDQLGGGMHRYSVDPEWRVPHFEKMLYDQAINARAYLEVYQASGHQRHAAIARDIFDYVLRDLTAPGGGFYAAEDADSEGEEGTFYLWKRDQIVTALGPETGGLVADYYGVTPEPKGPSSLQTLPGGRVPLHLPMTADKFAEGHGVKLTDLQARLGPASERLLAIRSKRPRPFRDDKIIIAWNGLMISALAYGATVLEQPRYATAAAAAADFILSRARQRGRLPRFVRGDVAGVDGYLDDYAFLLLGLTDLYEATFDSRWLREANALATEMVRLFRDEETDTLRYSATDHERLIAASDDAYDSALPSGQSVAALALLRLGRLTMNRDLEAQGRSLIAVAAPQITRAPLGFTQMLIAVDFALGPTREIVVAGPREAAGTQALLAVVQHRYLPRSVRLLRPAEDDAVVGLVPFLAQQGMRGGKPTAYVCENYVCDLPTDDPRKLEELLRQAAPVRTPTAMGIPSPTISVGEGQGEG